MTTFDSIFAHSPLMAILRGLGPKVCVQMAETAWDLGINLVEVTVQSPTDLESLEAVIEAGNTRGAVVGAGTVVGTNQIAPIAQAGAGFTVSPGLDLEVARASQDAGLAHLPGVATPTEVQLGLAHGFTWLKAFPAAHLGPSWFTTMAGPFPQAKFVATGGMNAANAGEFLDAGVRCVAVGSALSDPAALPALGAILQR